MKPTAEDLTARIWIDKNDIATVSETSQVDPDYVEYIRADLFASMRASEREKAALIAETKYIDAGFHHYFKNASICIAAAIRAGDKE